MTPSIICILDRSGSMSNMMTETVGAFNGFIDGQKKLEGTANVTLYSFDNVVETVFDNVPLDSMKELTIDQVKPRGMTSLYDAIGEAIVRSTAEKAIVLIQTDGEENSSHSFTSASIKEMIKIKESMGWEFHFLGSGIDAWAAGNKFGIRKEFAYSLDGATGVRGAMGAAGDIGATLNASTTLYRSNFAPQSADVGAVIK